MNRKIIPFPNQGVEKNSNGENRNTPEKLFTKLKASMDSNSEKKQDVYIRRLTEAAARGDKKAKKYLLMFLSPSIQHGINAVIPKNHPFFEQIKRKSKESLSKKKVLKSLDVSNGGNMKKYAYRVGFNKAIDCLKMNWKRGDLLSLPPNSEIEGLQCVYPDYGNPLEKIVLKEDLEVLDICFKKLKTHYRLIISKVFLDRKSYTEISNDTGKDETTLRQHKSRALNQLRRCMGLDK